MNYPTGNAQIASRRDHVDMVGLNACLPCHFANRHAAFLGKQFREMAVVLGIQVLKQHECHAGIVRQVVEQLRECFQTAGGGAHTDNSGATAFDGFLDGSRHRWDHGNRIARPGTPVSFSHTPPPSLSLSRNQSTRRANLLSAPVPTELYRHQLALATASTSLRILPISMNWLSPEGLGMKRETPSSLSSASSRRDREELQTHTGTPAKSPALRISRRMSSPVYLDRFRSSRI